MTQPSTQPTHATTADITAILAARKAAQAQAVQAIPALPQSHAPVVAAKPAAVAQPHLTAQSVTPAPATPTPVAPAPAAPAPAPVSDDDLTAFLQRELPVIKQAVQQIAQHHGSWTDLLAVGQAVSQIVSDALPVAHGTDAHQIVTVVASYAWDTWVVPVLPPLVKPFAGLLKPLMLQGIEAAYQLAVRPKKAQ